MFSQANTFITLVQLSCHPRHPTIQARNRTRGGQLYREEGAQRDKRSYIKREVDGQCRQGTGKRSIRD